MKCRKLKSNAAQATRSLCFFYEYVGDYKPVGDKFIKLYRWWCNTDPGDLFDLLDDEELKSRLNGAELMHVKVVDHLPAFCITVGCEDCAGYA